MLDGFFCNKDKLQFKKFQLIQKPPDNIRQLKRVDASQIQQLKFISAAGMETQNAAQKSAPQTQFLTAKTVSPGIKVIPNTGTCQLINPESESLMLFIYCSCEKYHHGRPTTTGCVH